MLLQRIAYLFYQKRETLDPDQVYLLTPNPVFQQYIDNVLPEMGERNPNTLTWDDLMRDLGLGDRGLGADATSESLRAIDAGIAGLTFEKDDFADLRVDDETGVVSGGKYDRSSSAISASGPAPTWPPWWWRNCTTAWTSVCPACARASACRTACWT